MWINYLTVFFWLDKIRFPLPFPSFKNQCFGVFALNFSKKYFDSLFSAWKCFTLLLFLDRALDFLKRCKQDFKIKVWKLFKNQCFGVSALNFPKKYLDSLFSLWKRFALLLFLAKVLLWMQARFVKVKVWKSFKN